MPKTKINRILLKLSGEALMGDDSYGIKLSVVDRIAMDIKNLSKKKINICIVIGGGNIFRGLAASADGMDRAQADYMGMLATVLNSLGDNLGKIGVLLELKSDPAIDLNNIGKNICMHIAATSPKSLDENSLNTDIIETEKNIIKEQLKESGKPDDIVEKMLDGKMKKFFEEVVLLNQKYVIDPSMTITQLLDDVGNDGASKISVNSFLRYELGQ